MKLYFRAAWKTITILLTIFGFLSLLWLFTNFISKEIFINDASCIVRPINEHLPFCINTGIDLTEKMLFGIDIMVLKDMFDTKIHIRGIKYIAEWNIISGTLSSSEKTEIINKLPVGEVTSVTTLPISFIPKGSDTQLLAIGILSDEYLSIEKENIKVFTKNSEVYYESGIRHVYGVTFTVLFPKPSPFTIYLSLLVVFLIIFFVVMKKIKKETESKKPT